ncbi:hypothetical protein EYR40_008084 [Pleurotus pulmonarius]|nr:hypothetical protein EYR38_007607 [Pleurotus pulmonarius]KAF4597622.1 hypothetical protein EYR40_008084 [Pleurotus pulmonarius]
MMVLRLAPLILLLVSCAFAVSAFSVTTSKTVKSRDGTPIFAQATGDPTKQSIVFVHGFALSGVAFDRLVANPKFRSDFYLVRFDMRGHGRSGKPNTPEAHTSDKYADDFRAVMSAFCLDKPVLVGWLVSLGAAVITDVVANNKDIPIAAAVALDGSPGIDMNIVPNIATPLLLGTLPVFNDNTNVTAALEIRTSFVDALFADPTKVPFSLKAEYLGQTVVQTPDVSALVSIRPQNASKLFEAGDAGKLTMMLLSGKSDSMVIQAGVNTIFGPHFKNLRVRQIDGGHAVFDDNLEGTVTELTSFVHDVVVSIPFFYYVELD